MLREFFNVNRRFCSRIQKRLPQAKTDIFRLYEEAISQYMNSRPSQVVVDVGGGKSCPFAKYKNPDLGGRIIAVDISAEEMRNNRDVDELRVANVTEDLPFDEEEADLIVSRSVLEHLKQLDGFVANSRRVLKTGGYFIHLVPCKYAPFALINQALRNELSKKLVHYVFPETKGVCGFPAHYDQCYYSAMKALLARNQFEVVDVQVSYFQSPYFGFFAPLFLMSALYEILLQSFGAKNLCAYLLVVARKK